jgi:hypothetical protein
MIGVPSPVALGLIAGIGEFIPYVGAAVAAVVKNRPQTFNEMLQSCLLHPPTIPIEAPNSLVRLRPRLRQLPKAMWSGPLSTQAGEKPQSAFSRDAVRRSSLPDGADKAAELRSCLTAKSSNTQEGR